MTSKKAVFCAEDRQNLGILYVCRHWNASCI